MAEFSDTERDRVALALDIANQTLAVVERDLKHLEQRAAYLREFVRLGEALTCTTREAHPLPGVPPPAPSPRHTAVVEAQAILKEVGHAIRLNDMVRRTQARGLLKSKSPREALRTSMRDHPELFTRVGYGMYVLTAWTKSRGRPPSQRLRAVGEE
jgi:hypothetical protein